MASEELLGEVVPYVAREGPGSATEVPKHGIPGNSHLLIGCWRNEVSGTHNLKIWAGLTYGFAGVSV
jgi:hypothetical protein